jgi:hypothetical protein
MPPDDAARRADAHRHPAPERAYRSPPMQALPPPEDKLSLSTIDRFVVPIGGQEIELQQLDYAHGGISLMRLRIREGKRFTIFDIDPLTAQAWGESMQRWAATHMPDGDRAA